MFGRKSSKSEQFMQAIQEARTRLNDLNEKQLMIEILLELKMISHKCDEIGRKIVIWSN